MLLDKAQRTICADIDDIAVRAYHAPVLFQRCIEILAPMTGGMPEVFIKATCRRMVWPLTAIVPFAKRPCGITGSLEGIRDGFFIQIQPLMS